LNATGNTIVAQYALGMDIPVGFADIVFTAAPGFAGYQNQSGDTVTPSGVDLSAVFSDVTGTFSYDFTVSAVAAIGGAQQSGASANVTISAQLAGIDDVDAQGNLLASAVLNPDGTATLDLTATPEPATLTLLGSGLLVVGFARARKSLARSLR
jgi:hypothetical protein